MSKSESFSLRSKGIGNFGEYTRKHWKKTLTYPALPCENGLIIRFPESAQPESMGLFLGEKDFTNEVIGFIVWSITEK